MNANVALDVDPRVAVFLDVQNLYFCTKMVAGENQRINYPKLLEHIVFGRNCVFASAYLMLKEEKDAMPFRTMLRRSGIDIKIKIMEFREKGNRKFNVSSWDIGMTLDMIKWAQKAETIILVSGSGSFLDTMQYLKAAFPVRVEVCGFLASTSRDLIKLADDFINITPGLKGVEELFIAGENNEQKVEALPEESVEDDKA